MSLSKEQALEIIRRCLRAGGISKITVAESAAVQRYLAHANDPEAQRLWESIFDQKEEQ